MALPGASGWPAASEPRAPSLHRVMQREMAPPGLGGIMAGRSTMRRFGRLALARYKVAAPIAGWRARYRWLKRPDQALVRESGGVPEASAGVPAVSRSTDLPTCVVGHNAPLLQPGAEHAAVGRAGVDLLVSAGPRRRTGRGCHGSSGPVRRACGAATAGPRCLAQARTP